MNEKMKKLWADQDSMPDIDNEEPNTPFNVNDFEVLTKPTLMGIADEYMAVYVFLESDGTIKERVNRHVGETYFEASRKTHAKGYGEKIGRAHV